MNYREFLPTAFPGTWAAISRMEAENNVLQDPTFTPEYDINLLIDLVQINHIKNMLELGTYKGHTSLILSCFLDKLTGVDIVRGYHIVARKYAAQANVQNIEFLYGDSVDANTVWMARQQQFDAIWIDTSHNYDSTLWEIAAYAPMAPITLLHDAGILESGMPYYQGGGVRHAFYEWLANNRTWRGTIFEKPEYPLTQHGLGILWRP